MIVRGKCWLIINLAGKGEIRMRPKSETHLNELQENKSLRR